MVWLALVDVSLSTEIYILQGGWISFSVESDCIRRTSLLQRVGLFACMSMLMQCFGTSQGPR